MKMDNLLLLIAISVTALFFVACNTSSTNIATNNTNSAGSNRVSDKSVTAEEEIVRKHLADEATTVEAKIKSPANDSRSASVSDSQRDAVADIFTQWNVPWLHGDCTLAGYPNEQGLPGPRITFKPDGTGLLSSQGRSTDTNDEYVMRFEAKDSNGNTLFHVPGLNILGRPTYWRLRIIASGRWYDFNPGFTFPRELFPRINGNNTVAVAGC